LHRSGWLRNVSYPHAEDWMEQRIADIDFDALTKGRTFFRSPAAWEDEVLYSLMVDRFSDGRENGFRDNAGAVVTTGTTAPFQPGDRGNATTTQAARSSAGPCAGSNRRSAISSDSVSRRSW
jgi:hypothetical protein